MAIQEALAAGFADQAAHGPCIWARSSRDGADFYGRRRQPCARLQTEAPARRQIMISQGPATAKLTGDLAQKPSTDAGSSGSRPCTAGHGLSVAAAGRGGPRMAKAGELPTRRGRALHLCPGDAGNTGDDGRLRDQLIHYLARRTGVRVLDEPGKRQPLQSPTSCAGACGFCRAGVGAMTLIVNVRKGGEPKKMDALLRGRPRRCLRFCDQLNREIGRRSAIQINAFDNDAARPICPTTGCKPVP